jgi:hypothetical protein
MIDSYEYLNLPMANRLYYYDREHEEFINKHKHKILKPTVENDVELNYIKKIDIKNGFCSNVNIEKLINLKQYSSKRKRIKRVKPGIYCYRGHKNLWFVHLKENKNNRYFGFYETFDDAIKEQENFKHKQ